jgi:hypothetical protein
MNESPDCLESDVQASILPDFSDRTATTGTASQTEDLVTTAAQEKRHGKAFHQLNPLKRIFPV